MAGKFRATWFWASFGTYKVNKSTYESKKWADLGNYAEKLEQACERLDENGYDVIHVVPITATTSQSLETRGRQYLGEAVHPITRGAVVLGERRDG